MASALLLTRWLLVLLPAFAAPLVSARADQSNQENAVPSLRILSARAAFGNVWHADVAFPLNADPSIKSVQFLFTTKTSF